MKVKKTVVLGLILLFVLSIVVGCSGGSSKPAEGSQPAEGSKPAETNQPAESSVDVSKWPEKDIKLIIPWPAGGATDLLGRLIAAEAEKIFGVSVVVENKAGGGGAVGHTEGAMAKPDGYTITLMTTEASTAHLLGLAEFKYSDHDPIMLVATSPAAMAVEASSPFKSMKDLIEACKAEPEMIQISSLAAGGIWNLAAVGVEKKAGIDFTIVPYSGGAPAITAALGKHVDGVSAAFSEVLPFAQDKKLRILGIVSDDRQVAFPDAPTMKEQGIDISMGAWWGIGLPKNTPAEIKTKIHDTIKQACESAAIQDMLKEKGFEYNYLNSADFASWLEMMNGEFKQIIGG